jgi:hypothetical protein
MFFFKNLKPTTSMIFQILTLFSLASALILLLGSIPTIGPEKMQRSNVTFIGMVLSLIGSLWAASEPSVNTVTPFAELSIFGIIVSFVSVIGKLYLSVKVHQDTIHAENEFRHTNHEQRIETVTLAKNRKHVTPKELPHELLIISNEAKSPPTITRTRELAKTS